MQVHIEGLHGLIPFDFVIKTAALGDKTDPWLRVEDFSFKWLPEGLLARKIHINRLEAGEVEVLRRPPASALSPESEPSPEAWPVSLPPIFLERFSVDRLIVDGSILGQKAEFTASGKMTVAGGGETVQGDLRVERLHSSEERAGLRWVLNTAPVHLDFDLYFLTPDSGTLSRLAGVDPGTSRLRISGEGPPDDWQGEMEAEAGAWGSIRCGLHGDATRDRFSLKAEGDFEIYESLIQDAITIFPGIGSGGFSLSASVSGEGEAVIDRLALNMDGIDTEVSGAFDFGRRSGDIRLDLTAPEPALFRFPGFPVSTEGLHARLNFRGSLDAPLLDVYAEVSELHAEGVNIGSAKGSFLVRPEDGGCSPFLDELEVQGRGSFNDTFFQTGDLTLVRQRVDWDLNMAVRSMDSVSVTSLRVFDGNVDVDLSGGFRISDRSLEGRGRIQVEDVGKLPFLEESGVKGRGSMKTIFHADGISRSVRMGLEGRLQEIGPIPVGLDPLVEGGGDFKGSVAINDGRMLRIADFRVAFPSFEFTLNGNADLVQETGGVSILGTIPDASVFTSIAGRPVGGMVTVKAGIGGGFRDPDADVEVTIQDLDLDSVSVEHMKATLHARRIWPMPEGRMNAEIVYKDMELAAGADVDAEMPFLRLNDMWIKGEGARVSGALALHIPSRTVEGDLKGSLEKLVPVAALLDRELEGRAGFLVRLSREGDVQNMGLELSLDDLSLFGGRARSVDLRSDVRDVLGKPAGEVAVGVKDLRHGNAVVENIAIEAVGGIGAIVVQMDGSGVLKEPFSAASEGRIRWLDDEFFLDLDSLKVEFGSHGLTLARPAEIRLLPENGVETTPIVLHSDSGRLEIQGGVAERIDLALGFEEIPLALLALAGVPEMEGFGGGSIRLSGTVRDPRVEAELAAEGLRLIDPAFRHMPRFSVSSSVSIGDGRMEVSLRLAEGESLPMEAFLAAPLNVSLFPMSVDFSGKGGIEGHVAADMDLSPLPVWFSMDGMRVSGRLKADVSLSGSPASPMLQGDVRVRNGTCEILQSGSVFREVDAHIRVSGEDLILEHGRAVDGSGGEIDVEGRLRLLAGAGFPFEGSLTMDAFRLVRLDDLRAVTSGELEISGTTRKADLSGNVRVTSSEVRIPDRLPPRIQELDVVEVNGPSAGEPEPEGEARVGEAARESSSQFELDLNLDIDIPGRTYIRGRGLDSEWKGALHVGGTAVSPVIRGELTIVRGHYAFFGERFSLASGNVFLDGSYPPEPIMDVTAELRKTDMTGRVILSGRPSTLRVEISSDPPMPQDEVMARLLFGRSLNTITPMQALTLARAMDSLAGGKTFGFVDRAQRAVGLDQMELVQSDDPDGSTALSVGKYVGEDAYVVVEKGLGADEGKVSVEYEVTPRITVQTEVGADATGGVEVRWQWDY